MSEINVTDVTSPSGEGVFDKLMESINKQILSQYENNRINSSDYASMYLGGIQAALAQSIQFVLADKLTEVQIRGAEADNLIKAEQLGVVKAERAAKEFEVASILPEQLSKLQEEVDLLQTQDAEAQLDGTKRRLVQDEEIATARLQQTLLGTENTVKEAQKAEILAGTIRADQELQDQLVTSEKQRLVMDEQIESANKDQLLTDEQIKTAFVERVIKDKEAAKLGLDNAMKIAENTRTTDTNFVYSPVYTE
ncbi:hypothetical protein BZG00_15570 [Salinivibrio kushneri]|uniref:Uncharacterized protein n=2 Tax=Pseudomonadota TaxID=1224 RepID=A0A922TAG6_9HYPH|nr:MULTISPECIES: hypothetical protein [Pseudomonadota]YP_008125976.1 virion structural protein [Alteromonas phage vB_AmaP_AD45-P1]AGM46943.1 hypothetical protein AD45P3_00025 [Alteromonas phage vB_AmaP_AD45-P3]AGM47060.1 hypothetical protein AD45P4_00025 [Alteromonas phage vB_AmaP_AD45-P4]AGM47176.1 hypothetical protein AD45P2_00025 [Alteromonas phage vB_AmaP_AD45-P2]AGM46823.1 hypothetical protein AD45P1_00025 [Alteromonas phage vB_AmaP_AD45-P1]KEQ05584.1 hypothetical protein GV68_08625 [Pse